MTTAPKSSTQTGDKATFGISRHQSQALAERVGDFCNSHDHYPMFRLGLCGICRAIIYNSYCLHHDKILVIEDGVPPSGTESNDVVVDFELSFGQTGKQLLLSIVALKHFQKDPAVAAAASVPNWRVHLLGE
jgi:hypothetical protein